MDPRKEESQFEVLMKYIMDGGIGKLDVSHLPEPLRRIWEGKRSEEHWKRRLKEEVKRPSKKDIIPPMNTVNLKLQH